MTHGAPLTSCCFGDGPGQQTATVIGQTKPPNVAIQRRLVPTFAESRYIVLSFSIGFTQKFATMPRVTNFCDPILGRNSPGDLPNQNVGSENDKAGDRKGGVHADQHPRKPPLAQAHDEYPAAHQRRDRKQPGRNLPERFGACAEPPRRPAEPHQEAAERQRGRASPCRPPSGQAGIAAPSARRCRTASTAPNSTAEPRMAKDAFSMRAGPHRLPFRASLIYLAILS